MKFTPKEAIAVRALATASSYALNAKKALLRGDCKKARTLIKKAHVAHVAADRKVVAAQRRAAASWLWASHERVLDRIDSIDTETRRCRKR